MGYQSGAKFGSTIASRFDVNGDGFDDVIIGAPGQQTSKTVATVNPDGSITYKEVTLTGQVFVFLGRADGLWVEPAWTYEGITSDEYLGIPVASAGDVNADGYDDILFASPKEDVKVVQGKVTVTLREAGAVNLVLGSKDGPRDTISWTYSGKVEGTRYGLAIASAGDVNNDGYDDVLIGDPSDPGTGPGAFNLFLGTGRGLSSTPAMVVVSDKDSLYGVVVTGLGDINNDGNDDIAISSPTYDAGSGISGAVFVYFGQSKVMGTDPLDADPWIVSAPEGITWFGSSLAAAGDINNDGYDDMIVRGLVNTKPAQGKTFIYLGSKNGFEPLVLTMDEVAGVDPFEIGTRSLVSGDINNDNYSDMMVGSWNYGTEVPGQVFVYNGRGDLDFAAPRVGMVDLTHVYARNGNFTITATVEDSGGRLFVGTTSAKVNGYPVAVDDSINADEDNSIVISAKDLLGNDWDPDAGDVLTITGVNSTGMTGELIPYGANSYLYNPNGMFESLAVGQRAYDSFTYTISDRNGRKDTATVTLIVIGANDAPVAGDDTISTDENTPIIITDAMLTGTDTDVDDGDVLSIASIDSSRTIGLVFKNADGTYTYDPNGKFENLKPGERAYDTFIYTVRDNHGGTDTAKVTVEITPVLPVLNSWVVVNDTGSDRNDKLTNDSTPQLIFRFSDAIVGKNSHVSVLDPNSKPVLPDAITGWGTDTLVVTFSKPLTRDGKYTVVLSRDITDQGGNPLNEGSDAVVTFTLDTVGTQITAVTVNNGEAQRTNVTTISLRFSDGVNIGSLVASGRIDDYIKLYSLSRPDKAQQWLDETRFTWSATTRTLTLDLTVDGFGGSDVTILEDGYFELRINASRIGDTAGNTLLENDSLHNGWLVVDRSTGLQIHDFFRLQADSNGDGVIDSIDFAVFQLHYDPLGNNDNTPATGDYNYDGLVDAADYQVWLNNHGTTGMIRPIISERLADANGDAKVDSLDFAAFQLGYDPAGRNNNAQDTGDWDFDGDVDKDDMKIWMANRGPIVISYTTVKSDKGMGDNKEPAQPIEAPITSDTVSNEDTGALQPAALPGSEEVLSIPTRDAGTEGNGPSSGIGLMSSSLFAEQTMVKTGGGMVFDIGQLPWQRSLTARFSNLNDGSFFGANHSRMSEPYRRPFGYTAGSFEQLRLRSGLRLLSGKGGGNKRFYL